jgi:hypothetical protein
MRIDVHTHIFPPEIAAGRERFFPGEPAFEMLYGSPKAKLASAESLLAVMDRDGVDRAVVFGFPWENTGLAARHNDYVLESAAKHSGRLIALGCVNPVAEGALREAERCLEAGAAGLGELAVYGGHESAEALARYGDLVACCRSRGAVLMVHANETVGHVYPGKAPFPPEFYYEIAKMASGLDLILAHWGGGLCFYELLKKEASEVLRRVYYDTAASPYLYRPTIYAHMAKIIGKEKILFGSDYPLLAPERYFREMEEAGLSPGEIAAITGENAARLFRSPTR